MNEEVTERGVSTVTPEIIKSKRGVRRNSTGKVIAGASLFLSKDEGKHRPHVLRASTGSCHDFCKYGNGHTFEGKDKHPFRHKSSGINATKDDGKNIEEKGLNRGGRREKSAVKITVSPKLQHLKHELPGRSRTIRKKDASSPKTKGSTKEREIIKLRTPTPVKIIEVSEELNVIKQTAPSNVNKIEQSDQPMTIEMTTSSLNTNDFSEGAETLEEGILSPFRNIILSDESESIGEMNPCASKTINSSEKVETLKQSSSLGGRKELSAYSPPGNSDQSEESDTAENRPPVVKIESSEEPFIEHNSRTLKKIGSSEGPVIKQNSQPKKIGSSEKHEIYKQKVPVVKKNFASSKSKVKQKEVSPIKKFNASAKPSLGNRVDTSSRPVIPEKPRTVKSGGLSRTPAANTVPAVKSAPPTISKGLMGRINSKKKTIKSLGLSNSGEKKTLKFAAAALKTSKSPVHRISSIKPSNGNAKSPSLAKKQNKSRKAEKSTNDVEEKTLYIVEPKSEIENFEAARSKNSNCSSSPALSSSASASRSLSSSPSVSCQEEEEMDEESESTLSDGSDLVYGEEATENCPAVADDKKRLRRVAMVLPEGKDQMPYKLRFRRGKIVNLQSENNGPRRLRFRQGRVVDDNQNPRGDVRRRSFRRRREVGTQDPNNPNSEAPAVVLRHQDAQGKRDPQGLFNHVIEETASKLVETRKSKVKALVGAFETVISLQESKPAATV